MDSLDPCEDKFDSDSSRFRVDRLNSLAVGCKHRSPTAPLPLLDLPIPDTALLSPVHNSELRTFQPLPIPNLQEELSNHKYFNNNTQPFQRKSSLRKTPRVFTTIEETGFELDPKLTGTSTNPFVSGPSLGEGSSQYQQNLGRRVSIQMQTPPGRRVSQHGNRSNVKRKSSVFLPDIDDVLYSEYGGNDATVGLYGKSLHNYTHDALPKMDNYRNLLSIQAAQRPTLDDLHDEDHQVYRKTQKDETEGAGASANKFGWVNGVLVRCLLNIWGVMLFLRLSWMVAQAGLIQSMIIIAISTVVTTITTLSMAAVSTNGEMKGGGIYYMISRSIGPGWGGSTGAIFSFANAAMAALNVVGFSESMIALLREHDMKIIDGGVNDNRIISVISVLALQGIIVVGKEYEAKCQTGLLVILLISIVDFIVGSALGPQDDVSKARGWIGLNAATLSENLEPGYRFAEGSEQNFFTIFSIFFPAVAGIQAGASISGDLKDPASAIPKGTLLAIFITSCSYALFAFLAGSGTVRDASGFVSEVANGTFTNCANRTCTWGLHNDFQVMNLMSSYGPLIYAGCFAATLSSALSCLVSGSEMFQALGKDEIYPGTAKMGKLYGKKSDPYYSYGVSFIIALIFILIADLNAIAPLISNFFMVTYALLNFCVFHADILKPLGWRPTFKYYNKWVSLVGFFLCIFVMFLMSWVTAIISIGCAVTLYVIVIYRKLDINWGSTTQAQTYSDALNSLQALNIQEPHVKNYRPQILVLTGYPHTRPVLVDFAHLLAKKSSLVICGNISRQSQPARIRRAIIENGNDWLESHKVKAFYVMTDNCALDVGCHALIQSTGVGKLTPNILLMGYKSNWQICDPGEVKEYFHVMHEALDNYVAIAILRIKDGLDISHITGSLDVVLSEKEKQDRKERMVNGYENQMEYDPSDLDAIQEHDLEAPPHVSPPGISKRKGNKLHFLKGKKKDDDEELNGVYRGADGLELELPRDVLTNLSLFTTKQTKGTIDVWWLYDDGGLTLLLPYIISTRKNWAACKLRVFALSNKKSEIEMEHRNMASLLSKFRIDYSDLTVIPDITKRAENSTKTFFDSLIKNFRGDAEECDDPEIIITDNELLAMKEKTNRHLRLRELLLEYSSDSNLVVMTLPVPRKGTVSAPLYVAWLECLTKDMPPFLLVRGNQTSVLTFYS